MIVSDASEFIRMTCGRSGSEKDIEQIKKLFHKEHNDDPMVKEDDNANQHNSNTSHDDGQRKNVLEGDAISRQAVLEAIEELKEIHFDRVVVLNKVRDRVLELPPVNPQPKTGHWIRWYEKEENDWFIANKQHCKCSECNQEYDPYLTHFIKYCNQCGAKMEETQEGSNKE